MSSKHVFEALPARPLSFTEADKLAEDGQFVPLSVLSEFPEWLEGDEWDAEQLKDSSGGVVMSLFYATEDYILALGFSDPDGGWVKIGRWEGEKYDPSVVEDAVQEWGEETYPEWKHGQMNVSEEQM